MCWTVPVTCRIWRRPTPSTCGCCPYWSGCAARLFRSRLHTSPNRGNMSQRAKGTFEIQLTPQPAAEGEVPGRLTFVKQLTGDLEATSQGQMLAARSDVKGSAGYVAIEKITGVLHGRSGTFVLQHSGTSDRGALTLSIHVVPDSATGQLAGLSGKLKIDIVDGKHFYDFEYELAER